jgi:hypothetical protein
MMNATLSLDAKAIVETLRTRKAQHVPATWERAMKTLKGTKENITKRTTAYVRAGIDYANLAAVKQGIEAGEREAVEPLPWGEWVAFPFIIAHKGAEYVRLYPAVFDNLKATVEYFIDGKPATVEQVRPLCLASEFRERDEAPLCFTLKAESIVSIG